MKKKGLFFMALMVFVLAQNPLFAEEKKEAVSFEEEHKDKSVIVLLYEVNVTVNEDWSYVSRVNERFKILKEDARELGEMELSYNKARDKITVERAYTITPDGKKHRYAKIQDFREYKGYPVYSDAMIKVITFPQVNIGSILERKTRTVSKGGPMENAFWYWFHFESSTPVKELNFTISWPKKLKIKYQDFNLKQKPQISHNGNMVTYSWHMENVYNPRNGEDYLPPPNFENVPSTVEFSSIKDWDTLSRWFYTQAQENLKINCSIEEAVEQVTAGKIILKDKVRAILEYIQDNFRYVSMSLGDKSLVPHPTDMVFKNKYGDCKDLSLLCLGMLKAVGIKAELALFNDEFSITDPKYDPPIPSLFDHVLLLVEDKKEGDFYIDPLLKGYDIGEYPLYYQGAYTLIINEKGGRFGRFPVTDEKRVYSKMEMKTSIGKDGSALLESLKLWDLDASIEQRRDVNAMDKEEEGKYYQRIEEYLSSGGKLHEYRMEGLEEKYGTLKSFYKVTKNNAFPVTEGMIIIDISGYGRGSDFLEKERKNPVFYPGNSLNEGITTYIIPEGFEVSYMPKNLNLDIGFFYLKREYSKKGSEITIKETARYRRLEVPVEKYGKLRDFFEQLGTKSKQKIILREKKPWRENLAGFVERLKKGKQAKTIE